MNFFSHSIQTIASSIEGWASFIQIGYFGIVTLLITYTVLGLIRIHLLTEAARPVKLELQLDELRAILNTEGIFSDIKILESASILSPLSWGVRNPVILLPEDARDWSQGRIRNVLIHEVCHIQRLDWLSHLLCRCVTAMYWCNPLVWYVARKLGEEAEQACDDAVVLYGRNQSQYANDLLEIAKSTKKNFHRHILAEAIAHSFLGSRVVAILDSGRIRNKTESVWVIRALLITLTSVLILSSIKIVPEIKIAVLRDSFKNLISVNYIPFKPPTAIDDTIVDTGNKPIFEEIKFTSLDLPYERDISNSDFSSDLLAEPPSSINRAPIPIFSLHAVVPNDDYQRLIKRLDTGVAVYPEQAERRGIEGYSVVEYEVSQEGIVINPVIIESSPGNVFNQSAIDAMGGYRYVPPSINGESVGISGLRARFIYELNPKPG